MENETVQEIEENKPKRQKKLGKIAQVYKLHQKGLSAKEIASKMKISERLVRAYIWRKQNPEKYKALLSKYFAKRRQKQENEEIKEMVNNNHKAESKEKEAEEK